MPKVGFGADVPKAGAENPNAGFAPKSALGAEVPNAGVTVANAGCFGAQLSNVGLVPNGCALGTPGLEAKNKGVDICFPSLWRCLREEKCAQKEKRGEKTERKNSAPRGQVACP